MALISTFIVDAKRLVRVFVQCVIMSCRVRVFFFVAGAW